MMLTEEQIYQQVANNEISMDEAIRLLESLNQGEPSTSQPEVQRQEPTSVHAQAEYPLSEGQRTFWIINKLAPANYAYNVPTSIAVDRTSDPKILRRVLAEIARRHACLRTYFFEKEGRVYQHVQPEWEDHIEVINLEGLSERAALNRVQSEARRPFNLERGPVMRASLFRRGSKDSLLLLCVHHIVFDGISLSVILREIETIYAAYQQQRPHNLPHLEATYRDFVFWQQNMLAGKEGRSQREYWLGELSGDWHLPEWPLDFPRPAVPNFTGQSIRIDLDDNMLQNFRRVAKQHRSSLFSLMLAAFFETQHRYTNQTDLFIGTPTSGRPRTSFETLVGYFMNMVVIRANRQASTTGADLLRTIQDKVFGALENGDYPLLTLTEELGKVGTRRTHLFNTGFYFQNWLKSLNSKEGNQGLLREQQSEIHQEGEFDLTLEVYEYKQALRIYLKYNPELFEKQTVESILDVYLTILDQMTTDMSSPLTDLHVLSESEQARMLTTWNETARELPTPATVKALFEAQARNTPESLALECAGRRLTYAEVNSAANRLAAHLRAQGLKQGSYVGVMLDRDETLPGALLAIFKAGAAYIPLDPAFPDERLRYMSEDSGLSHLITQSRHAARLPEPVHGITRLDQVWATFAAEPHGVDAFPSPDGQPHDDAYIIYTSGSTGKPKGVAVGQTALANFLISMSTRPGFSPSDRLMAVTTISFDIAGLEMFLPLITGGATEVVPAEFAKDGIKLKAHIEKSRPTVIQATPATWQMLIAAEWQGHRPLKILCGGEALSRDLGDQLLAHADEVWNMFGPTETTIWSTVAQVLPNVPITIGTPIDNTQVYVVNQDLQPVPRGAHGELLIGGTGLANRYHNLPEKTAGSFIENPFDTNPNSRVYRTGDLVRFRSDGQLEYLNRIDQQVKLRGYRIELGEIESALRKLDNVKEAAATLRTDNTGSKVLIGFISTRNSVQPTEQWRDQLAQWLPAYMIPNRLLTLKVFPETLNRKLDRKTLTTAPLSVLLNEFGEGLPPAETSSSGNEPLASVQTPATPEHDTPEDRSETPTTTSKAFDQRKLVHVLRRMAAEVLDMTPSEISTRSPLGVFGFDSLRFTSLAVALNKAFDFEVQPTLFYENNTLESIADRLFDDFPKIISEHFPANQLAATRPSTIAVSRPAPAKASESSPSRTDNEPIAIIGMAGTFPGSEDLTEFWENLTSGKDLVTEIPEERWNWQHFLPPVPEDRQQAARWGAFVPDVDKFDSLFFGISPAEAESMDPQQRLFMQVVWTCVEDAGYRAADLAGSDTGLYVGVAGYDYKDLYQAVGAEAEAHSSTGFSHAILANRVSFAMDWHGPSEPINAACASSTLAIHNACQAIRGGDCSMAIAGGVNLMLTPSGHLALAAAGMISADGKSQPFAKGANGYVRGEGAGAVLLKPLSKAKADGDHIYGVVMGSAVNHGGHTNSLTSPNPNAQSRLLVRAIERSGIDHEKISYIEASANGTELGDPLEINALKNAWTTLSQAEGKTPPTKPSCTVGSVKANIGHLETAAGIAGVIKVLLAMKHGIQPGNIHLQETNPLLKLENSPFELLKTSKLWQPNREGEPLFAGVSSFGYGGINTHVILSSNLDRPPSPDMAGPYLFLLSAKNSDRLKNYAQKLDTWLRDALANNECPPPQDIAFTLQMGRDALRERLAIIANSAADLQSKLATFLENGTDTMTFAGNVRQQAAMVDMLFDEDDMDVFIQNAVQKRALKKLAKFWLSGFEIDWRNLYDHQPQRVSLPTYPFLKVRHWIEIDPERIAKFTTATSSPQSIEATTATQASGSKATKPAESTHHIEDHNPLRTMVAAILKMAPDAIDAHEDLMEYGFDSFTGAKLVALLEEEHDITLTSRVFFDYATLAELSTYLVEAHGFGKQEIAPAPLKVAETDEPRSRSEHANAREDTADQTTVDTERSVAEPKPEPATTLSLGDQRIRHLRHVLIDMIETMLKLQAGTIEPDEDLAEYGFDSLSATKLIDYLHETADIVVSARQLADYPSAEELAGFIAGKPGSHKLLQAVASVPVIEAPKTVTESNDPVTETAKEQIEPASTAPEPKPAKPAVSKESTPVPYEDATTFAGRYPLSESQKALWFIQQMSPDNFGYNLPSTGILNGPQDFEAWQRALNRLVDRHPMLRTTFAIEDDHTVQIVHPSREAHLEIRDISNMPWEQAVKEIERDSLAPFNLETGPLYRVHIYSRSPSEHIILSVMHHIIFDGSSALAMLSDLNKFRTEETGGPSADLQPLETTYLDFVRWQQDYLGGEAGQRAWEYWQNRLAGELPVLNLPLDYPRPAEQSFNCTVLAAELPLDVMKGLKRVARQNRASMYTLLTGAFFTLLYRYTQQLDIVLGSPVTGRPGTRFEQVIGYFVNMIAVRGDFSKNQPFNEFLRDMQDQIFDALEHGDFPFPVLLNRLDIEQEKNQTPVYQSVFIYQNWLQSLDPSVVEAEARGDHMRKMKSDLEAVHETGGFDLTLEIYDLPDKAIAYFKYNRDLFKESRIRRMTGHFKVLLESILREPEKRIGHLNILPDEERNMLIRGFNQNRQSLPPKTIHRLFEEEAAKYPDRIAVLWEHVADDGTRETDVEQITFEALDKRANQLAHQLIKMGIGPETMVGLCMDRGIDLFVCIFGIMKSGGAYVPIDHEYPKERIANILEDANPGIILTRTSLIDVLPETEADHFIYDQNQVELNSQPSTNPMVPMSTGNLIYAIFTSGSTGRPKGVMISHHAVVNIFRSWEKRYQLRETTTAHTLMANVSFDVFVGDMTRALLTGNRVLLVPRNLLLIPKLLFEYMRNHGADVAEFVPAVLRVLTDHVEEIGANYHFLKLLIAGSDAWTQKEYDRFFTFCGPKTRLINSYGTTETTVDSTWWESNTSRENASRALEDPVRV